MRIRLLLLLLLWEPVPGFGQNDQFRNRVTDFLRLMNESVSATDVDRVEAKASWVRQYLAGTWSRMMPAGRPYQPPSMVDGGRAQNSNLAWKCGKGTMAVLDNAYYCAGSNAISYDGFFLAALSKRTGQLNHSPGDFAEVVALAHESGHALQYQMGIRSLFDFPNEQNADCFAGAAAFQLNQSGLLRPADVAEAKVALTVLADAQRAGPLQDAHGNAEQRVGAFLSGYRAGAAGCLPFKPTAPTRPPWMPPILGQ